MNKIIFHITLCILLFCGIKLPAQYLRFSQVLKGSLDQVNEMQQDKQGILWFLSVAKGLQRYDGIKVRSYTFEPGNPRSIASGPYVGLLADADNIIWFGTIGSGLERFDPATNTFTHFRHNANVASSLSNDTVVTVLEDHSGNLWIGTFGGLDLLNRKTGKFTHYRNVPNDPASIGYNTVLRIFEDKKGVLWVYSGTFVSIEKGLTSAALNRFDRATGKFTRFIQDSANKNSSLPGKFISSIYEDGKNNFWIGTDAGLYTMDRNTGKCTRFYPDPSNPGVLGQAPAAEKIVSQITFITEDPSGAFWVGMGTAGLNRYDPVTKKSTHFGYIFDKTYKLLSANDTATGLTANYIANGKSLANGLFWVYGNGVYLLNYHQAIIPFDKISQKGANAFHLAAQSNILWIATDSGLVKRDLTTQHEQCWTHDPKNKNSLIDKQINTIEADEKGRLWLGTSRGIDQFDPITEKFIHYLQDPGNPGSISGNVYNLIFDHDKNLWAASDSGLSRLDMRTGQFTNYNPVRMDTTVIKVGTFCSIAEDADHHIWTSSSRGALRLDPQTGKFRQYISNSFLKYLYIDKKGILWAGGEDGLYTFDKEKDVFVLFANEQSPVSISAVINIIEDDQRNLWVSTSAAIVKISEDRLTIKKFTETNGVRTTGFLYNDNFKAADGRLFLGIEHGYYSFYPNQISDSSIAPQLSITGFKLANREINAQEEGPITKPLWQTTEIRLNYDQNVFSFDFFAVDYINPGDKKYTFRLENYDDTWHDIGSDHRASFYNIPPGNYIFRVRAISADGGTAEKMIRIIINPPWWRTWWAYCLYAFFLIVAGYLIYRFQRSYIIKREREKTRLKELAQAKEIEKAYTELKSAQQQLIQSEKMASLGELTAGIAHEIQNPLNFINNFSEVNKELIDEMQQALSSGNTKEAIALSGAIRENEEKINHHGKRADAIVKGMLQHSRSSSGVKEPTDINALADEYLRLAYHGLRARDKSFNASMHTDFDPAVGNVNVIPQDIGRVILNLITNAFYVVDEKKKGTADKAYQPTVSVTTKRSVDTVLISVKDNGNGIPEKLLNKIFQPFFTTKPTGQGTGLGLSLSYDIVKAHGGELKVETKEARPDDPVGRGEGATFIIQIPASS